MFHKNDIVSIYVHDSIQNPLLQHILTVANMDTILSDASTTITKTEGMLTEVHGKAKNVTNHDQG